jgi:hypothetical protein
MSIVISAQIGQKNPAKLANRHKHNTRRNIMAQNRHPDFAKIVEAMESDFEKFYDKEVGAAGTRVRKHLQELAKLCKEVRNDVTAVKNARKESAGK